MYSQYEWSAGTNWSLAVYRTVTARPRSRRTVVIRNSPIQRTFFFSASSTRYVPTATVEKVMLNSYMLPHGARSTERARASTPPNSSRKASTVSEMAIRP
ncbi:hypothetical protein SGLAM104S_06914 [Streptomyces glaucescens]